jgi:hypothetical protein
VLDGLDEQPERDSSADGPRDEVPRLGPWLRRYSSEPQTSKRERLVELVTAAGVGLGSLAVVAGVLLVFVRFPLPTLGVLVALWIVGFVILTVKRRRAAQRERALQESAAGD